MPEAFESGGIHGRAIAWAGAAIVIALLAAAGAAYLIWRPAQPAQRAANEFGISPPLLESAPQPARAAYFADKDKLLNSWQWVDRQNGIARIPLEQAMQLLAQPTPRQERRP